MMWMLVAAVVAVGCDRPWSSPSAGSAARSRRALEALDAFGRELRPALIRVRTATDDVRARTPRALTDGRARRYDSSQRELGSTMNLGAPEILVILVVALLVFGPHKLPEIGRQVGGAMRELRKMQDSVKQRAPDGHERRPAARTTSRCSATLPASLDAVGHDDAGDRSRPPR